MVHELTLCPTAVGAKLLRFREYRAYHLTATASLGTENQDIKQRHTWGLRVCFQHKDRKASDFLTSCSSVPSLLAGRWQAIGTSLRNK